MKKRLLLIDGHALLHRGYHAMPFMKSIDGMPTGGIYSIVSQIFRVIDKYDPSNVVVAWDRPGTLKRKELYAEYKGNRSKPDDDLLAQIPVAEKMIETMNIPVLSVDGYEADDVIGTLAKKYSMKHEVYIFTGDRDQLQLIDDNIKVVIFSPRGGEKVYNEEKFIEEYGFKPIVLIDYKAMAGDSSDNIPGVKSIGDKSAKVLLSKYDTLEDVLNSTEDDKLVNKIKDSKEIAVISKSLATIELELEVEIDLENSNILNISSIETKQMFENLGFKSLIPKLEISKEEEDEMSLFSQQSPKEEESKFPFIKIDNINSTEFEESYTAADSNLSANLSNDNGYTIAYGIKNKLREAEDEKFIENLADTKLLDIKLLSEMTQRSTTAPVSVFELKEQWKTLKGDVLANYPLISEILFKSTNILDTFLMLESENIKILLSMEKNGICLDVPFVEKLEKSIESRIVAVTEKCYEYAGEEFNLSSPKQMQNIFFNILGIRPDGLKKNKSGYSLAAGELDKLKDAHPIVALILEHRELNKMLTTYVRPLPKLVGSDGKLHTTYNQLGAGTGRLSSENPNMQNIPIKTKLSRELRKGFLPTKGKMLIGADYSQVELRIAAILAGDKQMIESFNNDQDIHKNTASLLYSVPLEEVTDVMRYNAKTINFGVLYGMNSHGLSQATDMNIKEAAEFIDSYFISRPELKIYTDKIKDFVSNNGYVTTLFGRKREYNMSDNQFANNSIMRAAVNFPIQGSAADLIKLAAIKVFSNIKKIEGAELLLQVHDELVLECNIDDLEEVSGIVRDSMENIIDLGVKLKVDVMDGKNLNDIH